MHQLVYIYISQLVNWHIFRSSTRSNKMYQEPRQIGQVVMELGLELLLNINNGILTCKHIILVQTKGSIYFLLSHQICESFVGNISRLINSIHHNLKWVKKY